MRAKRLGLFKSIVIVILAFLVIRFLPLVIKVVQTLVVGLRLYWWAVVPILVLGLLYWRAQKAERIDVKKLRDVTNSAPNEPVSSDPDQSVF